MLVKIRTLQSFATKEQGFRKNKEASIPFDLAKSLEKDGLVKIIDEYTEPEKPMAKLLNILSDEKTIEQTEESKTKRKYTPGKKKTAATKRQTKK
jgi:hypothetical protein